MRSEGAGSHSWLTQRRRSLAPWARVANAGKHPAEVLDYVKENLAEK